MTRTECEPPCHSQPEGSAIPVKVRMKNRLTPMEEHAGLVHGGTSLQ